MALSFKNIYLNDEDKFLDKMLIVQKYSKFQLAGSNMDTEKQAQHTATI